MPGVSFCWISTFKQSSGDPKAFCFISLTCFRKHLSVLANLMSTHFRYSHSLAYFVTFICKFCFQSGFNIFAWQLLAFLFAVLFYFKFRRHLDVFTPAARAISIRSFAFENAEMESFWLKQLLKILNLQNFTNSRSRVHLTCTYFLLSFCTNVCVPTSNTTNRLTPRFPITSHRQTIKIIHRWARLRSSFRLFLVLKLFMHG